MSSQRNNAENQSGPRADDASATGSGAGQDSSQWSAQADTMTGYSVEDTNLMIDDDLSDVREVTTATERVPDTLDEGGARADPGADREPGA